MGLSQDLVSEFAKLTNNNQKQNTDTTVNGTFKTEDGREYVQIDGSDIWTPVTSTVEAETGERVTVLLKDHTATVTGNISSPSARTKTVQNLKDEVDEHGNTIKQLDNSITQQNNSIIQMNNSIKQQNDTINSFGNTIDSQNNKIQQYDNTIKQHGDSITSMNNTITQHGNQITTMNNTIESQNNTIKQQGDTIISQGNTITQQGNLISQQGNTISQHNTSIETANSNIQILNSGFKIEDGVLTGLSEVVVDELETNTLNAKYANIDFANIEMAAVEKLFSDSGIIKDLIVNEGKITGELVGVTIKGDLIEGNTVKADKLVIKGEDGIYYKLNVDALGETTASSDTKYQNGLDGSVIVANSITAEKVAVTDLVAFGATIGGFHIDDHSLYSGAKNSATNTTRGIFLSDDGQLSVGDSNNYLKYFKDTDGNYKLEIGIGGSTIDESINQAVDNKIDGLEIGGRNFLRDTANPSYTCFTHIGTLVSDVKFNGCSVRSTNKAWDGIKFHFKTQIEDRGFVEAGDTFTYSIWARKSDEETLNIDACITADGTLNGESGSANRFISTRTTMSDYTITTEWKRFYYTFTVPPERLTAQNGSIMSFRIEQNKTSSEGCCVMWACPKLEKGNKLTDWSPAPEDANPSHYTKTETDAKIQVQSDRITSTVNKVTTVENGLNNLSIGGRNILLNSSFKENGDDWEGSGILEFVEKDGQSCAHIQQTTLGTIKNTRQSVFGKLEPNTQYTVSGWVRTDNIVRGPTNPSIMFYHDGSYVKEDGTSAWFGYLAQVFKTNTGEGSWQYLTKTFTTDDRLSAATRSEFYVYTRDVTGDIYFYNLKLEKGNKPTDWTPALEDVDADISDAQNAADAAQSTADNTQTTVTEVQSKITQLSNMIANLVTDENGGSMMTQTSDGWTFNMSSISGNLEAVQNALVDMQANQNDTNNLLEKISNLVDSVAKKTAYITMAIDDNGDPCIELGKSDNEFKVRITNTAIDFLEGSSRIAYANNNTFYSIKIITEELQIGKGPGFVWALRANGNLGLVSIDG